MCFTRSSPLIHALPAQFPHLATTWVQRDPSALGKSVGNFILDDTEMLGNLVFEDTRKLMVQKLSSLQSQSSAQELLADFMRSDTAEVCVLLANMEETTCKTINHIRVMIEEAEWEAAELHTPPQCCKVFVLLLHFPPAQFFNHCYPALSLKGWDHCYLDTVVHSAEKGVVDIRDWFFKCCFPTMEPSLDEPDTLLEALNRFLPQTISVLSARVYFGNKKDGSFNSAMNATQRSSALKVLLFEKGLGEVLCDRFRAYWRPKVMVEYMERAAKFSKERESTLNITDSIQTQFKALFMDFCVFMLTRANENFNLDIVYIEDSSSPLHKLFLDIFKIWPVPELDDLNRLSNSLPSLQLLVSCPHFPFFSHVYGLLEKQVDSSSKAVNLQMDVLADSTNKEKTGEEFRWQKKPSINKLQKLIGAVMADLEPRLQVSYVLQFNYQLLYRFS